MFPGGARFQMSVASLGLKAYMGQGCYSPQQLNEYFTANDWWELEVITGVGINDNLPEIVFSFYPNPALDEITLTVNQQLIPSQLCIFDMAGRKLDEFKLASEKTVLTINNYKPGTYLAQLMTGKKIITQKFIKE